MEIRPGVTFIEPETYEALTEQARGAGLPVFVVSTAGRTGREAFFDAARASLPLDPPVQSARSWEALSDSLWEGIWLQESDRVIIVWPDASEYRTTNEAEYEMALSIFRDVAESLRDATATNGRPKMLTVCVGARSPKA
jgi:hypothetical protein